MSVSFQEAREHEEALAAVAAAQAEIGRLRYFVGEFRRWAEERPPYLTRFTLEALAAKLLPDAPEGGKRQIVQPKAHLRPGAGMERH